jgi:hypothetical protein
MNGRCGVESHRLLHFSLVWGGETVAPPRVFLKRSSGTIGGAAAVKCRTKRVEQMCADWM